MRILAITPIDVDDAEVQRRQERYDRLAPANLSVTLVNIGSTGPRALNSADDIVASEAAMVTAYREADASQFDAFLPDCILDPVLDDAASLDLPVYGIGRLTAGFLTGLGLPIGAVARNAAIAAHLDGRLKLYGVHAEPTAVLDLSVEDIADDQVWAAAVRGAVTRLDGQGIINACSAVEIESPGSGKLLIDPTAVALRMLAALSEVSQ